MLLAPIWIAICCGSATVNTSSRRHFIFVLVDDWGSYDVAWREQHLGLSMDSSERTEVAGSHFQIKLLDLHAVGHEAV